MLVKFKFKPQTLFYSFLISLLGSFSYGLAQQPNASSDQNARFIARLINLEAAVNEVFRYNATLKNPSGKSIKYELSAGQPTGWQVSYNVEGSKVTSLNLDAGQNKDISIEVTPAFGATPDKYPLPIRAISDQDTLRLDLEAVVRGAYAVELTTPSGKINTEVVAGSDETLVLTVKNTGTIPLTDISLSSQLPSKWEVAFEPSQIEQIEPGKEVSVKGTLKIPEKTIAGDYMAKITAKNNNSQSEVSYRVTVKTSLLSGWVGILIIAIAIGLIYYLIRKYGRR